MKKSIICFSLFIHWSLLSLSQDVEVYSKPVLRAATIYAWDHMNQINVTKPWIAPVRTITNSWDNLIPGGRATFTALTTIAGMGGSYSYMSDVPIGVNETPDCNKCYVPINALRISTSLGTTFPAQNVIASVYRGSEIVFKVSTVNGVVTSEISSPLVNSYKLRHPYTTSYELGTDALVNTRIENVTIKYYEPGILHRVGGCRYGHPAADAEQTFDAWLSPGTQIPPVTVNIFSLFHTTGCPATEIIVNSEVIHRVVLPSLIINNIVVPFNSTFNLFSLLTVAGPFLRFQGDAVNNLGIFDPNLATNSVTTITAIYNSPVGTVQRNFTITRDDFPNVVKFPNTVPFSARVCKNDIVNLAVITSLTGVTYVGDDVIGNFFHPMRTLIVNPFVRITRRYPNSTVSTNFQVFKVDTTTIVLSGVIPQICGKDASYNLRNLVLSNFSNGSFVGFNSVLNQNIVSGNLLNVSLAGAGNFRFRFTNINTITGCRSSNENNVVVRPQISIGVNSSQLGFNLFSNNSSFFCQNISVTTLTGIAPLGGVFSGSGVSGNRWSVPSVTGIYPIMYTFVDQANCSYFRSFNVSVLGSSFEKNNSGPNSLQVFNAPLTLCGNVMFDLKNSLKNNFSTVVGVFTNSNVGSINSSTLTSSLALGNSLYRFRFVDSRDGCFVSDFNSLIVRFPIPVSIAKNISVCASNSVVVNTLVGLNGSFTGVGVSSNGLFQSSTSGLYPVRYSVRNSDNCVYSDMSVVTVNSNPVVIFGGVLSICGNSMPVNLASNVLSLPVGTFTGVSVKNNVLDVSNVFYRNPTVINISYGVVSTVTGCISNRLSSFVYLPNAVGKFFVTSFCGSGNVVIDVDSARLGYSYVVHKGNVVSAFTSGSKYVFNYSPLDSLFYTSIKNRFGCVLSDSVIAVSQQSERIALKDTTLMNGGYSRWPEFSSLVPTGFKFIDVVGNDSSTSYLVLKSTNNGFSNPTLDVNYDFEIPIPVTYSYINDKGCLSYASQSIHLSRVGKYDMPMSVNKSLNVHLKVYPNPSNGDFRISSNSPDSFEYVVYDLFSRLICSGDFVNDKLISDIYIPGVYLLEVRNIRSREIVKIKIVKN